MYKYLRIKKPSDLKVPIIYAYHDIDSLRNKVSKKSFEIGRDAEILFYEASRATDNEDGLIHFSKSNFEGALKAEITKTEGLFKSRAYYYLSSVRFSLCKDNLRIVFGEVPAVIYYQAVK